MSSFLLMKRESGRVFNDGLQDWFESAIFPFKEQDKRGLKKSSRDFKVLRPSLSILSLVLCVLTKLLMNPKRTKRERDKKG